MPKRKRSIIEDFEHLQKKFRKMEQELKKGRKRIRLISSSSSSSDSSRQSSRDASPSRQGEDGSAPEERYGIDQEMLTQDHEEGLPDSVADVPMPTAGSSTTADVNAPSASTSEMVENLTGPPTSDDTLDSILLEILGEDPSAVIEYGPEIHKDLASRFEHIARNGLEASQRKELFAKYLTPSNCTYVAAPILNAEIKAALPENMVKRDKGLEMKQKQLAAAISCLASVMTDQFTSTQINQGLLQKLMDTTRMLCDMQHTDSKTRRNFAMFSVKKEMKEHLSDTKIDKCLFGENLSEALKTAKAVSKSGIDLKFQQRNFKKPGTQNFRPQQGKNLNWKTPAPARRQQGPPPASRSREPVSRRNQRTTSSRRSSPPPRPTRRR